MQASAAVHETPSSAEAVAPTRVGVGWIVSSLHVYLRDTGQVLSVVMTLWFWITPIMINEARIPQRFHPLIYWNPLSWVVRAYRYRLLSPQWRPPRRSSQKLRHRDRQSS